MKYLLLIFFISFSLPGMAQYEQFLNLSRIDCDKKVIGYFHKRFNETKCDTAILMPEIRAIEKMAVKQNEAYLVAMMGFVELQMLTRNYEVSPNYSIERLNFIANKMKSKGDQCFQANIEFYYGQFLFIRTKEYAKAFDHYEKMFELSENIEIKDYPSKLFNMSSVLYHYNDFEDYDKTIEVSRTILKGQEEDSFKEWDLSPRAFFMIGQSQYGKYNLDSAEYYFQKGLKASINKKNNFEIAGGYNYLGINFYKQKKYKEAKKYFERALEIFVSLDRDKPTENLIMAYLVDIYLRIGPELSARKLVSQMESEDRLFTYEIQLPTFYGHLNRYYSTIGNSQKALACLDSVTLWQEKNKQSFDAKKILRYQQQQKLQEIEKERIRNSYKRNIWLTLISLAYVLFMLGLILRNRRQKRKVEKAELEVKQAKKKLQKFISEMNSKRQFFKGLETKIEANETTDLLDQLQKVTILTKEEWEEFKSHFNVIYPNFYSGLALNFPNLTQGEIRFLSLKKLGFSNKEMADTLGVSDQSIRTTLYRLRKNLNLSSDDDITIILEGF